MPPPWFRSTPPPWWPAGEPWPPPDRRRWRRGRRFGRRLFVALTILTFLAISGIVNTLARLSGSTGAGGITRPLIVLAIGALVTVVVLRLQRRVDLGRVIDRELEVVFAPEPIDDLAGIHLAVGIPDPFELAKSRDQVGPELLLE